MTRALKVSVEDQKRKLRKILYRREITLLLSSSVIDDFPHVKQWLAEEALTEEWVDGLLPDDQRFVRNILPQLVGQSAEEWKVDSATPVKDLGPLRENWGHCTLCNAPTRWLFFIVNRLNGNRMNVGSECVKKFDIDLSASGKNVIQLIKDATKLRRLMLLDEEIPGIQRMVWEWSASVSQYDVVIPSHMERPFRDLGVEARRLYDRYVEPQGDAKTQASEDDAIVTGLKSALEKRDGMLAKMEEYARTASTYRYAARREIVRWLERSDLRQAIEWLKEDGVIKARTAHRITEPGFMKAVSSDLDRVLRQVGIRVSQVEPDRSGYLLIPEKAPNIRLFAKHGDLLLKCGEAVLGGSADFTLEDVLQSSSVADRASRDVILGELNEMIRPHGLSYADFTLEKEDFEVYITEWVLWEEATQRYILTGDITRIVNEFKLLLFGVGSKTVVQLLDTIAGARVARRSRTQVMDLYDLRKSQSRSSGYRR